MDIWQSPIHFHKHTCTIPKMTSTPFRSDDLDQIIACLSISRTHRLSALGDPIVAFAELPRSNVANGQDVWSWIPSIIPPQCLCAYGRQKGTLSETCVVDELIVVVFGRCEYDADYFRSSSVCLSRFSRHVLDIKAAKPSMDSVAVAFGLGDRQGDGVV